MGIFTIDIEKYYNEQSELGNNLLGLFVIQYPIYCIHANILDSTPDPLDNLDKVIVDFLGSKPNMSTLQISSLLGTSNSLVKHRISLLIQDNLLEYYDNGLKLTIDGIEVFKEKNIARQHKRSYDFYVDGITLKPLPDIFYGYYKYKFISEYDSFLKTWKNGKETIEKPFGPDLVHSAPDKTTIIENIFGIDKTNRTSFEIPAGLQEIEDLTYTKMSLHLMVSALKNNDIILKNLIDPYALYSISSNISYSQALINAVEIFKPQLADKIKNLEFKLFTRPKKDNDEMDPVPFLTTNWPEIDKYKESSNRCFNFAKDDLIKAIKGMYSMKTLDETSIINSESILEININKKILLDSGNKAKLINDLIRKRDYKFGKIDFNVFLMFVHYTTNDPYVLELIKFKQMVQESKNNEGVNQNWVNNNMNYFSISFRELCISSGELELLEKIDISNYMIHFN